jgi:hypothetical protein
LLVLGGLGPAPWEAAVKVEFMEVADGAAVADFGLESFGEPALDFDTGPMPVACGGGVFEHGHEEVFELFDTDATGASAAWLAGQSVNAASVEECDPQANHAVGAAVELADSAAWIPE